MKNRFGWLVRYLPLLAFPAILTAHVLLSYWGLWHCHYLVAPGNDIAPHLYYIQLIRQGNFVWGSYPPGFHYMIMFLSQLIGATEVQTMTYLGPSLLVLSGLAIFMLTKACFGMRTALLAYLMYALVSLQPLQTASDGGLPNIIVGDTLIPLALICWIQMWRGRYWWTIPLLAIGAIAVVMHHMSLLILLGVLGLSGIGLSIVWICRSKGLARLAIALGGVALLLAGVWLFYASPIFLSARNLLETALLSPTKSRILSWVDYSSLINGLIFQMGAVGLLLLTYITLRKAESSSSRPDAATTIVLGSYYLFYFVGSRLPTIEPERLARDLALPATILAAYAISTIYSFTRSRPVIRTTFVLVVVLVTLFGCWRKTKIEINYDRQVRFSSADTEAIAAIRALGYSPTDVATKGVFGEQELFWKVFAAKEIEDKTITLISEQQAAVYSGGRCLLTGYSRSGIWPDELTDSSLTSKYLASQEYSVHSRMEDRLKVWYLFCRRQ